MPWVVEVDRLGQAQSVSPASPFYQPTDPQIAFHWHASSKTCADFQPTPSCCVGLAACL